MRVGLLTNDSEATNVLTQIEETQNDEPKARRGATAMEYLVMASFVLVVLIVGAQQVSQVTGKMMHNNADATTFEKGKNKSK